MSCARRSATRSAPTSSPTSRSASCSPAGSTRRASTALAARRAGGAGADLLDRLRGGELRRARRGRGWSPSATAPTTTSWSCAPTRSSSCRGWSRPSTSPSATPRRCPTYLVSAAGRGRGQGRPLGRGRRRALRRLLHLRRRPAGAAQVGRLAALAAPLVEALPSSDSQGRASTTKRSASPAAPACRRSSATTPGRRSSRRRCGPRC